MTTTPDTNAVLRKRLQHIIDTSQGHLLNNERRWLTDAIAALTAAPSAASHDSKRWIPVTERIPTKDEMPVFTWIGATNIDYEKEPHLSCVFHEAWFEEKNIRTNKIIYWHPSNLPPLLSAPAVAASHETGTEGEK